MRAAGAAQTARICIEDAVLLPPMMEPYPAAAPTSATEARSLPRHLTQSFAARLPIGFCGIVEAAPGEGGSPYSIATRLYLYRDCNGLPRSFDIASHDRAGVASLFCGNDWLLARLWPQIAKMAPRGHFDNSLAQRGGWDAGTAAGTLIYQQSCRDLVHGDGFALIAETAELQRAHLVVSRLARRLLWRGANSWQVLDLARGWNATRGQGALSGEIVVQIVDRACARELGIEDQRRAG